MNTFALHSARWAVGARTKHSMQTPPRGAAFAILTVMLWATRRRLFVLIVLGSLGVAGVSILFISAFFSTPSCVDGLKNQDEEGVDCGGSCPYLCSTKQIAPTVLFATLVDNGTGRLDAVALVENKNQTAVARGVTYRAEIYRNDQKIRVLTGTLDLPPRSTIPVFVPGAALSREGATTLFLMFEPSTLHWESLTRDPRGPLPEVSNTVLRTTDGNPRIEATLTNVSVYAVTDITAVVLVRDRSGTVIGASSTRIPSIDPQERATALFSWNGPFSGTPVSVEVFPSVAFPRVP